MPVRFRLRAPDYPRSTIPDRPENLQRCPIRNQRSVCGRKLTKTHHFALPRTFYARDPREVAPELLGKILMNPDGRSGRIVEVEAYAGAEDPAAHSYRGQTKRNATMFGPPGHLYVYFSYGVHWCANASCGNGAGVLIRALEPLSGLERMRQSRPKAKRDTELCNGPGKLAQALGISGANDGADLVMGDQGFRILDDGKSPLVDPVQSKRIGITKAAHEPWRWYIAGNPNVSKR